MSNRIAELAREGGVVGAGGAGFPTHIKLDAQVEYVVVNGAECEPLLMVDQMLLVRDALRLADMLEEVRQVLGANEGRIAIKAKYKEAIEAVKEAIGRYPQLRIVPLDDFYPAGDEFVLVYETTGRLVPQGGIPLEVGVVVLNVETLWNLAEVREGRPVTHKWVTVAGAVVQPGTFHVPLGVSIWETVKLTGGPSTSDFAVLDGGPMMGKLVKNLSDPVTKTTKGLVVLPSTSPVIQVRARPLASILHQARAACCQCQECTMLCPRYLLGHELAPHKVILASSYLGSQVGEPITAAFLCSECGLCDLYACPMGLSPRRVNQALKEEMSRWLKNPHKGAPSGVHPWRSYRRVPVKRLISSLGLKHYERPAPAKVVDILPRRVVIPLRQHIGVPAIPVVNVGDKVETGQLVAEIPEGKLGSRLFASISGWVTDCTSSAIVITSDVRQEEDREDETCVGLNRI
ncbi:4Fe-4S dicluster domain-containing protein [Neomoorella carbonis]|jgi:Na+-translocating ferredoxin:NAD+ oxidoreductase RnfC subunit|uniref:4Fe-4S dicluster domain-containing protein n=1 Tax=Neomoorella carbonis TaxID=3062783 RepID=UPI003248B1CE